MRQLITPDPSLTCKQLAEQYAGNTVMLKYNNGQNNISGYIVGYYGKKDLLIDRNDEGSECGWVYDDNNTNQKAVLVVNEQVFKRAWLCGNKDILTIEFDAPTIIQKPYPNKCSQCLSPSMKTASYTLCSNVKCKSRKLFKSVLKSAKIKKPNHIECDKCGGYVWFMSKSCNTDGSANGWFDCDDKECGRKSIEFELKNGMTWSGPSGLYNYVWVNNKGFRAADEK